VTKAPRDETEHEENVDREEPQPEEQEELRHAEEEDIADGEAVARLLIENAEEIVDPLDGLVERCLDNPGAAFTLEVLSAAAELRKTDLAAYHQLRFRLKAQRMVPLADFEKNVLAFAGEHGSDQKPSQADMLVELAEAAELFHTADLTAFADIEVNGHRETWPIRKRGFRRWLARRYFEANGGAPNSEAMQAALGVLEAKAHYDAPERQVCIRTGGLDGKIYLDLADDTWAAVEIDEHGWRIVDTPPVRFTRTAGMKPLPVPQRGGTVETLRRFLNLKSDADFVLTVSWLLAAMRNTGPYPVLALAGEKGTAKSTFSAMMRSLVDPNTAPLRALPREDRDLFIAASNAHLVCFDNISGTLPAWVSDTLCRLATGGGFATRALFTDDEEMLFDAERPILLNGIDDVIGRADLADRSIFLSLEAMPKRQRRTEKELWREFEAERPGILGALLDAIAVGIRRLPTIHLAMLPRMADFAEWASACETAMWAEGTFEAAYTGNINAAIDIVIDADTVASAVRAFMASRTQWSGTASDLLGALTSEVGERTAKSKEWPSSARAFSVRLRRAASSLREIGIDVSKPVAAGASRSRVIQIGNNQQRQAEEDRNFAFFASVAFTSGDSNDLAGTQNAGVNANAFGADEKNANASSANANLNANRTQTTPAETVCVHPNALISNEVNAKNAKNAKLPLQSGRASHSIPDTHTRDGNGARQPEPRSTDAQRPDWSKRL
jgi:hypothetical protein